MAFLSNDPSTGRPTEEEGTSPVDLTSWDMDIEMSKIPPLKYFKLIKCNDSGSGGSGWSWKAL